MYDAAWTAYVPTVTLEKFLSFRSIRLCPNSGDAHPSQGTHGNKMVKVIGVFTWCVKTTLEYLFPEGDKSGSRGSKLNYKGGHDLTIESRGCICH